MRYILNSAVITAPGTYEYQLIDVKQTKAMLELGRWESTIRYPETALAFKAITGTAIAVNRKMEVGDRAIVFRLTKRLSAGDVKGEVGIKEILANCEIGVLQRTQ